MRRGLLTMVLLGVALSCRAGEPALAEFESMVKSRLAATDNRTWVFHVKQRDKWARQRVSVSGLRYDVRKTDSLVSPIVGEVSFATHNEVSQLYDSKDQAEASTDLRPTRVEIVRLRYAWRGGAWHFASGERLSDGKTHHLNDALVWPGSVLSPWVRLTEGR